MESSRTAGSSLTMVLTGVASFLETTVLTGLDSFLGKNTKKANASRASIAATIIAMRNGLFCFSDDGFIVFAVSNSALQKY